MAELTEDVYEFLHTKWNYSKAEREAFQVPPRSKKRFSLQETTKLTFNIRQFLLEHQLDYPEDIKLFIEPGRRGMRGRRGRRGRRGSSEFYKYISRGICRTVYSVYRHVHRKYSHLLYGRGDWGEGEEEALLQMVETHRGDWNAVAESLGRSRIDCIDKIHTTNVDGKGRVGRWGHLEKDRLMEAVNIQLREKGLQHKLEEPVVIKHSDKPAEVSISSLIDWKRTSRQVGTRTRHQCLSKWAGSLFHDTDHPKRVWTTCDDVTLIETVLGMRVRDEYHLDWMEVLKRGGWKGRPGSMVSSKWSRLVRCIPGHRAMFFYEKCAFLAERTLPALRRYLSHFRDPPPQPDQVDAPNALESEDTRCDSELT